MRDSVRVPWLIGDQAYKVEVEKPGHFDARVVAIFAKSGYKLPRVDWDAHGFDGATIDLCVAEVANFGQPELEEDRPEKRRGA